ncbi:MAG: CPBP family glutamic-type intramembrane protease [Bacteroidota bacterium]
MRIVKNFRNNKGNFMLLLGLLFKAQLFFFAVIFSVPGINNDFQKDVENIPESFAFSSNLYVILFVLLIQPALEEFLFRWHVGIKKDYKFRNKVIFTVINLLLILFLLQPFQSFFSFLLMMALIASIGLSFYNVKKRTSQKLLIFQILITSLVFSFNHSGSNSVFTNPSFAGLSFVLFFMGAGFILSYLRVNYGLFWAILIHFAFNMILTLPQMLSNDINTIPVHHSTSCYEMTLVESGKFEDLAGFKITDDYLRWEKLNLITGIEKAIFYDDLDIELFEDSGLNRDSIVGAFSQKKAFKVYQLNLEKKDDSCKINLQEVLHFLNQEGLIVK